MSKDHNDIYSIVERLAILEGRITPAGVKHGLNRQQKSVPQMPALFKPKTQKILGGDANAKNPMSGYAVGGCEESVDIDSVVDKDNNSEEAWHSTYYGGLDESDGVAEDSLTKVKQSFNDYLKSIEEKYKDADLKDKTEVDRELGKKDTKDRDLVSKDKPELDEEELAESPVKTITNECGLWEVFGNESTGFEIRHGNGAMKSRFKSLEEAEMALEMFQSRRAAMKKAAESADYVEEK